MVGINRSSSSSRPEDLAEDLPSKPIIWEALLWLIFRVAALEKRGTSGRKRLSKAWRENHELEKKFSTSGIPWYLI